MFNLSQLEYIDISAFAARTYRFSVIQLSSFDQKESFFWVFNLVKDENNSKILLVQ